MSFIAKCIECMMLLLIPVFLLGGCSSAALTSAQKEMEKQIDQLCKEENFNGSILVVNEGRIILNKGYGLANCEEKAPNKPDTVFRIASITKQFTAAAILLLEESGALKVDDPISEYIPDYPNGDKITLHHLLTHTSGIAEYTQGQLNPSGDHPYTPTELVDLFKDKPLVFNPGEKYSYCNSNYVLLGYIIERVSHMTYEDFMEENIFEPLGMDDTGYDHNESSPEKAIGYDNIKKARESAYFNMTLAYAAGGLESTTQDLYKWLEALNGTTLLTEESLNKMFTPFLSNYAYGWGLTSLSPTEMGHSGSIFGFSSFIYRDTERGNATIILSNETLTYPNMLNKKIASLLKAEEERQSQ